MFFVEPWTILNFRRDHLKPQRVAGQLQRQVDSQVRVPLRVLAVRERARLDARRARAAGVRGVAGPPPPWRSHSDPHARETLEDPFSAALTPIFVSQYSFFSIFRDLYILRAFGPL